MTCLFRAITIVIVAFLRFGQIAAGQSSVLKLLCWGLSYVNDCSVQALCVIMP